LKERLTDAILKINPWMNEASIKKAYNEITNIQATSLMAANKRVWELFK
jgi:type I restriction enzyme R subunit